MKKLNFKYYYENKKIINPLLVLAGLIVLLVVIYLKVKNRPSHFAKKFIGQEETGNNQGFFNKSFENLMYDAGWRPGYQWCAFFTKMIWQKTLKPKHRKIARKIMTGSTQINFERFKKYGKGYFKISQKPRKNALVIWQSKKDPSRGHTGLITKVNILDGSFETIEGNSNKGGSQGIVSKQKYSKGGSPAGMRLKGFIIPV